VGSKIAAQVMSSFKWGDISIPDPDSAGQTIEVDECDTMFDVLVQKLSDHLFPNVTSYMNAVSSISVFRTVMRLWRSLFESFRRE